MICKALVLAASLLSSPLAAQEHPDHPPPPPGVAGPQARDVAPGASVVGADGTTLGTIERVETGQAGEARLYVRGEDGTLRAIPTDAATVQNGVVILVWIRAEFEAAPVVQPEPVTPADEVTPPTRMPPPRPEPYPDATEPPIDPPALDAAG